MTTVRCAISAATLGSLLAAPALAEPVFCLGCLPDATAAPADASGEELREPDSAFAESYTPDDVDTYVPPCDEADVGCQACHSCEGGTCVPHYQGGCNYSNCKNGKYCSLDVNTCSLVCKAVTPCKSASDCGGCTNCEDGACFGSKPVACYTNADCGPGKYCSTPFKPMPCTNKCYDLPPDGGAGLPDTGPGSEVSVSWPETKQETAAEAAPETKPAPETTFGPEVAVQPPPDDGTAAVLDASATPPGDVGRSGDAGSAQLDSPPASADAGCQARHSAGQVWQLVAGAVLWAAALRRRGASADNRLNC